jgi:hypothetical protein
LRGAAPPEPPRSLLGAPQGPQPPTLSVGRLLPPNGEIWGAGAPQQRPWSGNPVWAKYWSVQALLLKTGSFSGVNFDLSSMGFRPDFCGLSPGLPLLLVVRILLWVSGGGGRRPPNQAGWSGLGGGGSHASNHPAGSLGAGGSRRPPATAHILHNGRRFPEICRI